MPDSKISALTSATTPLAGTETLPIVQSSTTKQVSVANLTVDRIEIIENGSVQIRTKTIIMEDGAQISSSFHRHVITPGDNYNSEDARVRAICSVIHTANTVAEYKSAQSKKFAA